MGPYESTNFPVPETKCIGHCVKFLRLIKASQSTVAPAYPKLSSLAASWAMQLADAVEESVGGVQRALPILRSALETGKVHVFQQFIKADLQPHSLTYGMWANARTDTEITSNSISAILSTYSDSGIINRFLGGTVVRRSETSNPISEAIGAIITDMETMVNWWTPVDRALANVEDATYHTRGATGFDDNAVKVALRRIIYALDSYCDAYATCPEAIRKAAEGMPLHFVGASASARVQRGRRDRGARLS
ncbi:hypothetical protein V8B97DRAFT_1964486 [Scleroderma yunnanense]